MVSKLVSLVTYSHISKYKAITQNSPRKTGMKNYQDGVRRKNVGVKFQQCIENGRRDRKSVV